MGFNLLERVYAMTDYKMSGTELSVLAALAFRANDKTLLCFPKLETLAKMTHLHPATIPPILNKLRDKSIVEWDSGGLKNKRGKGGKILSNSYRLNLPEKSKKTKNTEVITECPQDSTVSPTARLLYSPGRDYSIVQDDTTVSPRARPTEIITSNTKPRPNRRESASDLNFDEALESMDLKTKHTPSIPENPTAKIFRLCEIPESDIGMRAGCMKTILPLVLKLGRSTIEDILDAFESEKRQGEMKNVKNLFGLLVKRLQAYTKIS